MPSDDHRIVITSNNALTINEIPFAIVGKMQNFTSIPQSYSISITTILTQECSLGNKISEWGINVNVLDAYQYTIKTIENDIA